MVIRVQDGDAECCLIWTVCDISVNCEFKMICMHKMKVIAKISCYFERSVVTLKLRKEYLNTVTYNIPIILRIKYWTVWYIEPCSVSTYTGVTDIQRTVRFFGPPVFGMVCIFLTAHRNITTKILWNRVQHGRKNFDVSFEWWIYLLHNSDTLILCIMPHYECAY